MNIAHFSWEYPPLIWGGLGTFAIEMTQQQKNKGHNITVFTLNYENKLKPVENWNNIQVYRPKALDITPTLKLILNQDLGSWGANINFFSDVYTYNIQSAQKFVDLVDEKKEKYDLIDCHDWLGILAGMMIKKEKNIPLMFHVHSTEQGRSLGTGSNTIKKIEYEGGQIADCIITVSNAMKKELIELGFPSEKIRVCWNGVDSEKYDKTHFTDVQIKNLRRKYSIKENETMLFFIGRLVTVKGAHKLIEAMPKIIDEYPNTKLVILGIGDLEDQIKNKVKELKIENNVCLNYEFVDEKQRILHYAASDIVVLPSLYEPFGIVCTEAMSMGKPVVVGAKGTNGMREQVISEGEKQCGVHINPSDPDDIAWGIKQILESKEKRIKMGINARKRVIEEFTWDKISNKTLDIYNEFINKKKVACVH